MRKTILAVLAVLFLWTTAAAQSPGVVAITVTNAATNITIDGTCARLSCLSVVVKENSATPTAVFSITPRGSTTAINIASGGSFEFDASTVAPFTSGQVVGTIVATTSGPFSFVAIESAARATSANGSSGGGGSGGSGLTTPFSQFSNAGNAVLGTTGNDNSGFLLKNVAGTDVITIVEGGGLGDIQLSAASGFIFDVSSTSGVANVSIFGGAACNTAPGYMDCSTMATPGNPAMGYNRWYMDSTTGNLTCLTSAGVNCIIPGSAVTANGNVSLTPSDGTALTINTSVPGYDSFTISTDVDLSIDGASGSQMITTGTDSAGSAATVRGMVIESHLEGTDVSGDIVKGLMVAASSTASDGTGGFLRALEVATDHAVGPTVTDNVGIFVDVGNVGDSTGNVYGIDVRGFTGSGAIGGEGAGIRVEDQAATVYAIKTGTGLNSFGDFVTTAPTLVGSLPSAAAGNAGYMRSVSDSTAVALEGQTCVGSGSATALAFSNGTVWKCF